VGSGNYLDISIKMFVVSGPNILTLSTTCVPPISKLLVYVQLLLQLDVFLLQMQFVNVQIFLVTHVIVHKALADPFFPCFFLFLLFFARFVLCCLIAVVCIRADFVIGQ
jgi:hypothetical protein